MKNLRGILFSVILLILAITFYFFLPSQSLQKRTLRVMAYSSFVSVFGPGQYLKKEFEKTYDCKIKWIKVPDSTLFIQRLSLRKDGFKTDVVLGLDQLILKEARRLKWKKTPVSPGIFSSEARKFLSEEFIPYNWSPMSFLAQKEIKSLNLEDLLREEYKYNISIPSPRTSSVGLQFYYWIWSVFQEKTPDFLKKLKNQLYGLPSSWSTSYALFQRGHVDLSFSYLSSLLYHYQQRQMNFYFIPFKEGQPFQVELSAVSGFCTECELATQFVQFLVEPVAQKILKEKNYMLSVRRSNKKTGLLKHFPKLKFIEYQNLDTFLENKEEWLNQWE